MKIKFALLPLAVMMVGCGAGQGGAAGASDTSSSVRVGGVAAEGAPIANSVVTVTCSGFSGQVTTSANGSFSLPVPVSSLPCILSAKSVQDGTIYGLTVTDPVNNGPILANITPLTDLILEKASIEDGSTGIEDFIAQKKSLAGLKMRTSGITSDLKVLLESKGYQVGRVGEFKPFSDAFEARSGDPYDDLIEEIRTANGFSEEAKSGFVSEDSSKYPESKGGRNEGLGCEATTVSWTVGGNTCDGMMTESLRSGGKSSRIDDLSGPAVGNAIFACNDGSLSAVESSCNVQTSGGGSSPTTPPGGSGGTPPSNGGGSTTPPPAPPAVITTVARTQDACTVEQKVSDQAQSKGIKIAEASWLQVVQKNALTGAEKLSGGKEVLFRIDPTSTTSNVAMPTSGVLKVYDAESKTCTTIALARQTATTIPATVKPTDLSQSLVAKIPASLVKPGMSYVAAIDTSSSLSEADANNSFVRGAVSVAPANAQKINMYLLKVDGVLAEYPVAETEDFVKRFLPIANAQVINRGEFVSKEFDASKYPKNQFGVRQAAPDDAGRLLAEMSQHCRATHGSGTSFANGAGEEKCVLLWPSNIFFGVGGLGETTGVTAILNEFKLTDRRASDPGGAGKPYGFDWIDPFAQTYLHELAHVYGLGHADCGKPDGVDKRLYADGTIGADNGFYDHGRMFFVTNRANTSGVTYYDVTAYCGPGLISDRAYNAIDDYISTGVYDFNNIPSSAARVSRDERIFMVRESKGKVIALEIASMPKKTAKPKDSVLKFLGPLAVGTVVRAADLGDGENVAGPYYVKVKKGLLPGILEALGSRLELVKPAN